MSLTIFVHVKQPQVSIVRWFRDQKLGIDYPRGPVVQMSADEFRRGGLDCIRQHFSEFAKIGIISVEADHVFSPEEARKFFKDKKALFIWAQQSDLVLWPGTFRRRNLGGFVPMPKDTQRKVMK